MKRRQLSAPVALEDRGTGEIVRLRRRERHLRQADVAEIAGVSQQTVSMVENGVFDRLGVRAVRLVALAVGVDLPFAPRCDGALLDRIRDRGHARLTELLTDRIGRGDWKLRLEYSFNHFGDRGSADVLAWHEATATLLIIEVKTRLTDIQALLRSLDVKERVVPGAVSRDLGWRPRHVGTVVVLPDDRTQRRIVERHRSLFATALPARTVAVRKWVGCPSGSIRGIWFLTDTDASSAERKGGAASTDGHG